jgi:Zn-finger nucleic acid-binding protein
MDCPKCSGTLAEEEFGGVRVDRCDSCHGIWFDAKEVRALVAHAQAKPDDVPQSKTSPESASLDEKAGTCPRDGDPLHRIESLVIEGLHYDQCMKCRGAWLDAGELKQITDRPDAAEEMKFFNEFD